MKIDNFNHISTLLKEDDPEYFYDARSAEPPALPSHARFPDGYTVGTPKARH